MTKDHAEKFIIELFVLYVKRLPSREELDYHLNNFINVYKLNKDMILKEFTECTECLLVDTHPVQNNNVLVRYISNPSTEKQKNAFSPILAINYATKRILTHSNSYLLRNRLWMYNTSYENGYNIYKNIIKNYFFCQNNNPDYEINEKCIYMANAFTDSNVGHCSAHFFSIIETMM